METNTAEIEGVFAGLVEFDPACGDESDVKHVLAGAHRLSGWLEVLRLNCRQRLAELAAPSAEGPLGNGDHSPDGSSGVSAGLDSEMADLSGRSGAAAKSAAERSRVCHDFPELKCLLAAGKVSVEHLDVLARVTRSLTDRERSDLLAITDRILIAADGYVASFEHTIKRFLKEIQASHRENDAIAELERQRSRSRVRQWIDRDTGMHKLLLELDPVRAARVEAALEAAFNRLRNLPENKNRSSRDLEVEAVMIVMSDDDLPEVADVFDERFNEQVANDSAVFAEGEPRDIIATTAASSSGSGGQLDRRPDITLLVDAESFFEGRHVGTVCETIDGVDLPIDTARRLACDARVTVSVVDADGVVRRHGQEIRTANRQQRRALAAMYATCAHPECKVPFGRCRIHHVVWYSNNGATLLSNLLPLCERHHHQVHEGGWNLTMGPDRTIAWFRPDGTIWWEGDPRDRQPAAGFSATDSSATAGDSSGGLTSETWEQPRLC